MFKILIFTIVTLISLVTSQGIGQGAGVGGQNGGSVAGPCVNGICPTGYSCNNNWCYSNSWNGGGGYCLTNIDCPRGSYCQYNSCVPYNSGSCANVFCPVGYYCVEGGCMQSNGGGGCQDNDSRCATWVQNGFCNNNFYTYSQKRRYCASSCNLC